MEFEHAQDLTEGNSATVANGIPHIGRTASGLVMDRRADRKLKEAQRNNRDERTIKVEKMNYAYTHAHSAWKPLVQPMVTPSWTALGSLRRIGMNEKMNEPVPDSELICCFLSASFFYKPTFAFSKIVSS